MGFAHRSRSPAQTTNERTYDVLPKPDIFQSYRHRHIDGYGHEAYDQQKLTVGFVVHVGGSNERLDRDCPRRHDYGRFTDYGRQRGTLRPGDYTQLFQHSRDDQFQRSLTKSSVKRRLV